MTERKPVGMGFESWVDKQVREAEERGEFDNLPSAGKPLPKIERPLDAMEWAADWVRREGHSTDVMLPPGLQLRREKHRLSETVRDLRTEKEVREVAEELNARIKAYVMLPEGPQVVVAPVDVDEVVERWRSSRQEPDRTAIRPSASETDEPAARPRPSRWWRRRTRESG